VDYQFQKTTQDEYDLFFSMEGEAAEQHGFLGYLRGDYGRDGREFHTTWFDGQADLKTDVFRGEFDGIINYLRDASIDPVEGPDVFKFHCLQNMRRRTTDTEVRFKIVTYGYSYYFRCQPQVNDYNLYCFVYDNRFLLPSMERPNNAAMLYKTGADYWQAVVSIRGTDMAPAICGGFLIEQLGEELSREENQFCRELFAAMFEATAGRTDPNKLIYPYPPQEATERGERSLYFEHRDRNGECASAIGTAISDSYYKQNHYNLDIAAMTVIQQYGFPRVNAVLARVIQRSEWDGRYSDANKQWAREYLLPEMAFEHVYMNEHPVLIDSFADRVRKLYAELNAERFTLPGQPESGEAVEGYGITRAITFDDGSGFAIANHPEAGPVCWQFKTENGARDYFWGHYCNYVKEAEDNFVARIAVHMSDGLREKQPCDYAPAPEPPAPPQRKPRDREVR
jgi:hypothetical protein